MTTEIETSKRSVGRRILWIFRTTFISLLLIVILGGLAWAALYGRSELNRSFSSVTARIDANKQRIALLNEAVAQLNADDPLGKIDTLRADANDLDGRLAEVQNQMTADLARQSDLLTALQEDVTAAASLNETAVADTAALGDALITLQNDINDSNGRIDSLGGEIDGLRVQTDSVSTAAAAAISDTELGVIQQTVALFQIWEQIARARLHLAEDNVGLAAGEVEQTLRLMDMIVAASAVEDTEALELVQVRLALAFNSLPDDPETAVRDLENAWGQLDAILTARLYPEGSVTETETEMEATPTVVPEATPAPTATPETSS